MDKTQAQSFVEQALKGMNQIHLNQIDSHVNFFGIQESKYFLSYDMTMDFLNKNRDAFEILQIAEQHVFTYDDIFMDTKNYDLFRLYAEEADQKIKVRTRKYLYNDEVYFQIKYLTNDRINVFSYRYPGDDHGKITNEALKFYEGVYTWIYGHPPKQIIFPTLNIQFDRSILYHKETQERINIDFNLVFTDVRNQEREVVCALPDLFIAEVKTSTWKSALKKLLKKADLSPVENMNKYILGLRYTNQVNGKETKFLQREAEKIAKMTK